MDFQSAMETFAEAWVVASAKGTFTYPPINGGFQVSVHTTTVSELPFREKTRCRGGKKKKNGSQPLTRGNDTCVYGGRSRATFEQIDVIAYKYH